VKQKLIAGYFLAQGSLTVFWWVWLFNAPDSRSLFFAPGTGDAVLNWFAYPDIAVFSAASVAAGVLVLCKSKAAKPLAWITTGAVAYACVGGIAVNWPLFQVPLADVAMIAATTASAYASFRLEQQDE
jgi:hypothetical protein